MLNALQEFDVSLPQSQPQPRTKERDRSELQRLMKIIERLQKTDYICVAADGIISGIWIKQKSRKRYHMKKMRQ